MTKREPFARVEPFTSATWAVAVGGHDVRAGFQDRQTVEERVEKINAAHDKAVREAVEEFRERAARVCEDSVTWWPNRNMNECTKTPPELAEAIRALPVDGK